MKYKITVNELLEIIKQKKINAENQYLNEMQDFKIINDELKGEINAYTDLICLIESKKLTPKLEKKDSCGIKYLCVDCPDYNKTCGGRK